MVARRRTTFMARRTSRRPHYLWIRQLFNSQTLIPSAGFNQLDMLADYRTQSGIDLNLPEFTIWRLRVKVSVKVSVAPATAFTESDGILVSAFCDSKSRVAISPVVNRYEDRFLIWQALYASEGLFMGALPAVNNEMLLYREIDVKSHRRLENIGDTLLLQLAPIGLQTSIIAYSLQSTILTRLRN